MQSKATLIVQTMLFVLVYDANAGDKVHINGEDDSPFLGRLHLLNAEDVNVNYLFSLKIPLSVWIVFTMWLLEIISQLIYTYVVYTATIVITNNINFAIFIVH